MKCSLKKITVLLFVIMILTACGKQVEDTKNKTVEVNEKINEVSKEFAISANGNYYSNVSAADSENE